jgi:O-antigen ligase
MAITNKVPDVTGSVSPTSDPNRVRVWLLIVFLVLEYARPALLAALRIQMGIIVVMFVMWAMAKDRPWSGILTAQVLFFVLCFQAIASADNNYAAYITTRTMFGHLSIALGLSWVLADLSSFRRVMFAWLLIMGYLAVFGLAHDGRGPGAMVGDENDLALGCATAFPFAFYGFERLSGTRRWLCGVIVGVLVAAIVVTFSRGGFVALVAVGLYCWIASRHKIRGIVALILVALLVVATASDKGRTGQSYYDRLQSMFETDQGTAEQRQFLWEVARNMWRAHPILGVGGGNFTFLVGKYQSTDYEKPEFLERDWSGTATHSAFFEILAEQGSVGALLWAYIAWAHFRTIRRLRRQATSASGLPPDVRRDAHLYGGALGGAMIGLCAAGAFLSVAYYPYLWYFSAMTVGLETAITREIRRADSAVTESTRQPGH